MIHAVARFVAARFRLSMPLLVLALSACSVLPESETLTFFRLSAPEISTPPAVTTQQSSLPAVLRIDTPYANRAVDSTRIIVVPEADRVSAYRGARWADAAPVLVRDRLIEAFRASRTFRSVTADSGSLGANLALSSELFQFNVVYLSGAPVVRIVFDATLADADTSRILASRRFDIDQVVDGKDVPEVVRAFGQAVDTLAEQLLQWSREQALEAAKP